MPTRTTAGPGRERALDTPARREALARTGLVDAPPSDPLARLVHLGRRLTGSPVGLVSFVTPRRQFFVAASGLPEPWATRRETPLTHSFCQHVVRGDDLLVVDDAARHPLVRDNPAVRDLGVAAYLGAPVRTRDGEVLGAFCVIDSVPRRWTDEDRRAVADLAGAAATAVTLRTVAREHDVEVAALHAGEQESARRRLERLRDDLTRTVAHELRTPLTSILGYGELLLDERDGLDPEQTALLTTMMNAARRLGRLATDLSDLTGLADAADGAGDDRPVPDTVLSLSGLVADEAAAQERRAAARGLSLTTDVEPDVRVRGDGPRLARVVDALLTNATTYTAPGGHVHVGLRVVDGVAELTVTDDGVGVPGDERARVFDRFTHGTSATDPASGGTGLGLPLARAVVERHGGTVALLPRDGSSGTVARVRLRCAT